MPEIYKNRILKLLRHADYTPLKLSNMAKTLGVRAEDYEEFEEAFDELYQAGHVVLGSGNVITLPKQSGKITGKFRSNPKGFGFVIPLSPNEHGDLFIPPNATANAVNGDTVIARVVRKGTRASGEIIEILERGENRIVGTLLRKEDIWYVEPDGTDFIEPILVGDISAKGAVLKDKVVVEIITYPTARLPARGVILEVLGRAGTYETEIKSIVRQFHLPEEFNDRCIWQAHQAGTEFNPELPNKRKDLTKKIIVTIDPPDAKDFDDAISLERDAAGNWTLGVHIADVSHFVVPDSALDIEAQSRGNSAYLPQKTIPMLPEILSNGICSLQPGQKRFTKSAFLKYDNRGSILSRSFANTVICSTERLTYQQADKILKGQTDGVKPEVVNLLKDMEKLSRTIERRRDRDGMLHLDLPETDLIYDKAGQVIDACPADNSYPHTIIEMFMVEANEAVATLLHQLNVPFMRRIHPDPDALTMKNLSKFVRNFGVSMPKEPDRFAIQQLLSTVKGKDYGFMINLVVLRSFEKAQYSPSNIGHYALASKHYCHFTSPIRRYADLLIHRLVEGYFQNSLLISHENGILPKGELVEIGKHITFTEQRSEDAESELKTVLILQMLGKKIGEEFDGVVTGLANFGVFVQLKKFGIEGLIQQADLGPGEWKFNPKTQTTVGLQTAGFMQLGQTVRVRIVSVNISARQLSVVPARVFAAKAETKENTFKKKSKKGQRKMRKPKRRR